MIVKANDAVTKHALPGIEHRTLAGPRDGLTGLEVWHQRIAPGGETPWHRHDCEEVVVVLQGSGVCECEASSERFAQNTTLVVPPGVVHRLRNDGEGELVLLASLSTAPVVVETPERERIPLPWSE